MVEFSKYANMPVINGLSDVSHPCQAFADALTILDNFGSFDDVFLTYIGDGNNVCQSLMEMAELAGFKMAVVCPKKYAPKSVPKSVIVSEPASTRNVSVPAPPVKLSSPSPPFISSAPSPPLKVLE